MHHARPAGRRVHEIESGDVPASLPRFNGARRRIFELVAIAAPVRALAPVRTEMETSVERPRTGEIGVTEFVRNLCQWIDVRRMQPMRTAVPGDAKGFRIRESAPADTRLGLEEITREAELIGPPSGPETGGTCTDDCDVDDASHLRRSA